MANPKKKFSAETWFRLLAEGVVIVVSIVLALALDAWWDGVQQESHRNEVIDALVIDFETTRERLAESIDRGDSLVARARAFLQEAHVPAPVSVPIDSLQYLVRGAIQSAFSLEYALASYRGAVASGDIRLLRSQALVEALAQFDQALASASERNRILQEGFYEGQLADLRRDFGSLNAIVGPRGADVPDAFRLSETELRHALRGREVYAVVMPRTRGLSAFVGDLRAADSAASDVISELERLRSD